SNQMQRERLDLALIADEIPRGIARALVIQIDHADARRRSGAPSSEIGDLVTRARAAEQIRPWRDNLSQAMQLFEKALQRDPRDVGAMLGIARVSVMAQGNFVELDPPVDLDRAGYLINEVLKARPHAAAAHYIFAQLQKLEGHYEASIQSF